MKRANMLAAVAGGCSSTASAVLHMAAPVKSYYICSELLMYSYHDSCCINFYVVSPIILINITILKSVSKIYIVLRVFSQYILQKDQDHNIETRSFTKTFESK